MVLFKNTRYKPREELIDMGREKKISPRKRGNLFVYGVAEEVDGIIALDQRPKRVEDPNLDSGAEIRIDSSLPAADQWNIVVKKDSGAYFVSVQPKDTSMKDAEITVAVPKNSRIYVEGP
jgi:hypothetical protein